ATRLFARNFLRWHGFCSASVAAAWESWRRHEGRCPKHLPGLGSVPMQNALLVGLSRQMALSRELDIVANNIANIDTNGYKADNAAFSQFLSSGASDGEFNGNDRRISFVQDRASWIDLSAGAIERTGNPLDVAIDGNGYLVVQTTRGKRYTRNGALAINGSGQLVTSQGDPVLGTSGPITFQSTDHNVSISPSGII